MPFGVGVLTQTGATPGDHCAEDELGAKGVAAVGEVAFDVVATNPPFHQGKATTCDVAGQFIRDAARVLRPGGRFYLVANRFLPYEDAIREALGTVKMIYSDNQFKVLRAVKRAL